MSEIKNGGLDQYGAEPFKQQQFGIAGAERVNSKKFFQTLYTLQRRLEWEGRGEEGRRKGCVMAVRGMDALAKCPVTPPPVVSGCIERWTAVYLSRIALFR